MGAARRWYIYLVCMASLQAMAWAVISLVRDLLIQDWFSAESAATSIAIVIVGLPIYIAHWLWAQGLARRDPDERGSTVRWLYLYAAMASLLGACVPNAFDLVDVALRGLLGLVTGSRLYTRWLAPADLVVHALVAMAVLGLLWLYHWRLARGDYQAVAQQGRVGTIQRWVTFGFSAAGLAMVSVAVSALLRWLLFQIGSAAVSVSGIAQVREVARLAVGLVLWLPFWGQAQRRFAGPDEEERASVLRKVYLYAAVFIGIQAMVTTVTFVLASLFRRILPVAFRGDEGDIRVAISVLVPMATLWGYHAWTLRRDAATAGEARGQRWVGQLYRYLVAGIGLAAVLVALAGLIGFLIRSLAGTQYGVRLPDSAAWFCAMLAAGLPYWLVPWWRAQKAALAPGTAGDEESRSMPRRIYLYFFLFAAAMTVLSSGVYVVARLVGLALGVTRTGNLADLGQAIGYSLIAVVVWLYHSTVLRADGRRARGLEAERLGSFRVAVVDAGDGRLGRSLAEALRRELPGLSLQTVELASTAEEIPGPGAPSAETLATFAEADLIVGPWRLAAGAGDELARATAASPAHKLLFLTPVEGGQWIGVRLQKEHALIRDAVRAVRHILAAR
jgi:Domain of unknown function (DUF5671)